MGLSASSQSLTPASLSRVDFEQKLDAQVSLSLPFRDETGRDVKLGNYFGAKPVILVLGYFECPMLCTLTLNGMVESLEDIKWNIGNQFDVACVSINPRETPVLAAAKKKTYLRRYGRAGAEQGWHFLTGDQASTAALAAEVGFHYAYDPVVKQYAHPAGLIILTPQGRVAKYLFGVTFTPDDLYSALNSASGNHIGTRIEQFVLLCFHYSPIQGKYGPAIMVGVRSLGAVTLAAVLWLLVSQWRQSRVGGSSNATRPHGPAIPVHNTEPLPFTTTTDGHR
jgi:protein SCO1/2